MRCSPGIYTIVNRSPIGSDYKQYMKWYFLDNQRFELVGDSQITVEVTDNLIIPEDLINAQYYFAYKVANKNVIGNVSTMGY